MKKPATERRMSRVAVYVVLGVALVAGAGTRHAAADVTITSKITFDGVGEQGWGAREGTNVFVVTTDKSRRENDSSPAGKTLRPAAGGGNKKVAIITRLDKAEIIHVDYVAKNYYERTFEDMKKNLSDAVASLGEGGDGQSQDAKKEQKMKWQPLKFDVKRPGAKETIHEFPCEETVITATTDGENVETGQRCSLRLTVDVWSTPRTAALDELGAYRRKQLETLGVDMDQLDSMGAMGGGLGASDHEALSDVSTQVDKVPGYPIRTRFTLEKEGDCGAARGGALRSRMIARREARMGASGAGESTAGFKKVSGLTKEVVSIETGPAPAGAFDPPREFTKTDPPQKPARAH